MEGTDEVPEIGWLREADNLWGVPVLDVRPVTLGMLATSRDPQCAANAVSFAQEDGLAFIGQDPPSSRTIPLNLSYRIDKVLADGALYLPQEMEHKWALFFHGWRILFVRSWTRQLVAVANTACYDGLAHLTSLRGSFTGVEGEEEEPDPVLDLRIADFLIRSHVLDLVWPAPLPPGLEAQPQQAALWCMSLFGNRALVATPHRIVAPPPEDPLRTYSLLHIAVARGEEAQVRRLVEDGLSPDLLDRDGLTPLHWSLSRDDLAMAGLLLSLGSPVDVRSSEGATPLMQAVQTEEPEKVEFFLRRGADPNAADARGFTALHRAAEMGLEPIVRLLLSAGADPHVEAQGHTPRSLAEHRGHLEIARLLL